MIKLDFTKFKPEQGKLLISEPFMNDPNFRRSVVLLASHNEEGSIGFALNRPMVSSLEESDTKYGGCLRLEQVMEEFAGCKFPLWDGGPVQRDSLFFVHTLGDEIPDSIPILSPLPCFAEARCEGGKRTRGIFWNGNFETVKALIKGNAVSEKDFRFFIGYSGWSSKQLESEIKRNSWLVAPATMEVVMNAGKSTDEKLWQEVLKSMGKDYSILANFPENPLWN